MVRLGLLVCVLLGACGFELSLDTPLGDGGDAVDAAVTLDGDDPVPACPLTYTAGYRFDATLRTWLVAEQACEADLPGHTHLVVLETEEERALVGELAQTLPGDAWIGMVRDPGGTAPWPWRYVTGGAAAFAPFEGGEPNNLNGNQLVVVLRKGSRFLYDYGVVEQVYSICECDHRPPVNADYDPGS